MDQDFELGMPGRIPLAQRFADPRRNPGYDKAALRGNKMAAHRGTVRDFRFALRQVGDIDVVENRKAAEFRGRISQNASRAARAQKGKKERRGA